MEQLQLIPFTEDHLDEASLLFMEVFNKEPWNEKWNQEKAKKRLYNFLSMPGFTGIIAVHNDILGIIISQREVWYDSELCFIHEFCVHPQEQKKGIGRRLMDELQKTLKSYPVKSIYLLTKRDSRAHAFYTKNGFRVADNMVMMGINLEDDNQS